MAKVKGPAQIEYTAVPHRPLQQVVVRMTVVVLVFAAICAAYLYGSYVSVRHEQRLLNEVSTLRQLLDNGAERERELRQQVAVLENSAFVDKGAVNDVRNSNRELTDRIAELEKDIALYQGIMSPSDNTTGLTIQEVSITSTAQPGRYRFKVMLTQVGNNSRYLRGFVGINIMGVQDGEITAYPLKDVSENINDIDIKFRYRYFSGIPGRVNSS